MKCDAEHWRDIVAAAERRALASDEVSDFEAEAEAAGGADIDAAAEAAGDTAAASVGGNVLVWAFDGNLFVGGNQTEPGSGYRGYAAGAGMGETEAANLPTVQKIGRSSDRRPIGVCATCWAKLEAFCVLA